MFSVKNLSTLMYALNFLLKMLKRCFYVSRNRFKLKEGGLTLQLPQPVYPGGSDANWKVKTLKTGSGWGIVGCIAGSAQSAEYSAVRFH